jgi:hypothetical protein
LERPEKRHFNPAPRRPDNGRNDNRSGRAGSSSPRPARANGQQPASAERQREPSGDAGGLPAFLQRDRAGAPSARGSWRHRTGGRHKAGGGAAAPR